MIKAVALDSALVLAWSKEGTPPINTYTISYKVSTEQLLRLYMQISFILAFSIELA